MSGRNVDLFSVALDTAPGSDPVRAIRRALSKPKLGSTEWWLAEKAVVILDPRPYRIAWPPSLADHPLLGYEPG